MEAYRSGHNGPDSKSGSPHGLVGSNPTASAINPHRGKLYAGFPLPFCGARFLRLAGNGARGAPFCGALQISHHTAYAEKWIPWCPNGAHIP